MPNCKRCGKKLNDDEFYLCSECEEEGLYQDESTYEDDDNDEKDEDYAYQ